MASNSSIGAYCLCPISNRSTRVCIPEAAADSAELIMGVAGMKILVASSFRKIPFGFPANTTIPVMPKYFRRFANPPAAKHAIPARTPVRNTSMQDRVMLREAGLRDGLQVVRQILPTATKLKWCRLQADYGFRETK